MCQYLRECIDLGMDFDTNLLYEDTLLDTANDPADSVDSPMASSSSSSIAELSQTTAAVGNENNGTSNGNDSQSGLSVAIDAEKEIALDIDLLLSTRSEANSRKSMSAPKIALPPPFSCRGKGRTVVVHSMAETLKLFLESLGLDPVVVNGKCSFSPFAHTCSPNLSLSLLFSSHIACTLNVFWRDTIRLWPRDKC